MTVGARPWRKWMFGLCLSLNLGSEAGGSPQEDSGIPAATLGPNVYEDSHLGFRLTRPGPEWSFRTRAEDWVGPQPPAISLSDSGGAVLAVYARDSGGRTPAEDCARLAKYIGWAIPRQEDLRPAGLRGEEGLEFDPTGEPEDLPPTARVLLVQRKGRFYALAAFVPKGREDLDALSGALGRGFSFLERHPGGGEAPPVDLEGPGWRVRSGTAEHALVGVRMTLAPGWRYEQAPGMPRQASVYGVNIHCPDLDMGIRIQSFPRTGRTWESAEAAARIHLEEHYLPSKDPDTRIAADLDGSQAALEWKFKKRQERKGEDPSRTTLWTAFRGDERVNTIEVVHARVYDPRIPGAVRDALARTRFLGATERRELAEEFASGPDPQLYVGDTEYLRGGIYGNFRHRLTWKKPSSLWQVYPGELIDRGGTTLAEFTLDEAGVIARLKSVPTEKGDNKWTFHSRVVKGIQSAVPATEVTKPVPSQLGGRDGVRSTIRFVARDQRLRYLVATTLPLGQEAFLATILTADDDAAEAEIQRVLGGLAFRKQEIPGPRTTATGWEDPRFGFRIDTPPGPFVAKTLPVRFAKEGGTVVLVESGGARLVVAAREWPDGRPALIQAAMDQVLAVLKPGSKPPPAGSGARDGEGVLSGVPCRWKTLEGIPGIRIAHLRRGGALFMVGCSGVESGDSAPSSMAWFRFTD